MRHVRSSGRRPIRLVAAGIVAALAVLLPTGPAAAAPPSPTIVGGDAAEPGEYAWQVALVSRGFSPANGQFCGGSLIAADAVLTAAHCVHGARARDVDVFVGQHDLRQAGERIRVASIVVHPNYNPNRVTSDVAVLHLATASTQGTPGRLISAAQASLWEPGDMAWITGWGATSEGGSGAYVLQEASVPIVSDADCAAAYGTDLTPQHQVCAGYDEGGVDTCQGDSGGPMMVPNARGRLYIVGVTSWGLGCARAGYPGVYAEVARYLRWISAQLA